MDLSPALATAIQGGVNIFLKYYDLQRQNELVNSQIETQNEMFDFIKQQNEIAMAKISSGEFDTESDVVRELTGAEGNGIHPTVKYYYEIMPAAFDKFVQNLQDKMSKKLKDPSLLTEYNKWLNQYSLGIKQGILKTVEAYDRQRTLGELDETVGNIINAKALSKEQKIAMVDQTIEKYAETGQLGDFASVEKIRGSYHYAIERSDVTGRIDLVLQDVAEKMKNGAYLAQRNELLPATQKQLLDYVAHSSLSDEDKNKLKSQIKQNLGDLKNLVDAKAENIVHGMVFDYTNRIIKGDIRTRVQLDTAIANSDFGMLLEKSDWSFLLNLLKSQQTGSKTFVAPQIETNFYHLLYDEKVTLGDMRKIISSWVDDKSVDPTTASRWVEKSFIYKSSEKMAEAFPDIKHAQTWIRDYLQREKINPKYHDDIIDDVMVQFGNWVWNYVTRNPDGTYSVNLPQNEVDSILTEYIKKANLKKLTHDYTVQIQEGEAGATTDIKSYKDVLNAQSKYLSSGMPLTDSKNILNERLKNLIANREWGVSSYRVLTPTERQYVEKKIGYFEYVRQYGKHFISDFGLPENTDYSIIQVTRGRAKGMPIVISGNRYYAMFKEDDGRLVWYQGQAGRNGITWLPTDKTVDPSWLSKLSGSVSGALQEFIQSVQKTAKPTSKSIQKQAKKETKKAKERVRKYIEGIPGVQ